MSVKTATKPTTRDLVAMSSEKLDAMSDDMKENYVVPDSLARYSLRNLILIGMQYPSATDVAGFKQWVKRGRRVRKGERGIAILAPSSRVKRDKATGEPVLDSDGNEQRVHWYRTVYVFDIAQTDEL